MKAADALLVEFFAMMTSSPTRAENQGAPSSESIRISGTLKRRNVRAPATPPTASVLFVGAGNAPDTMIGYAAFSDASVASSTGVLDCANTVSVGTRIPKKVRLERLPPRIVKIVPAYEGYRFFLLADGRIVIVDPDALTIVYIVSA